ncbi:hypothetical protein GCM10011514_12230 [Emticicia aquatilis]|uniref:TANFOR domain-containing protein n=2 Tax=Emticicia aquatilis TaxID=1537369 RepID=A0A916YKS2_9BACT|nr:hypothetical protein GCM10011514_12230 [Emticicia aquatilis]
MKTEEISTSMKNILILFSLLFCTFWANAQFPVNVTVQLIPPYSTRLSDYANNPGKAIIMLRNTQPRAITVYLRANITGDNGIQIFTNPNFRASRSITLQPNIPYTLNISDLQDVFDINQLSTRNITIDDIERKNGLPEGIYQVCVRAYDFTRQTTPLSAESPLGCTSVRLTQLEPPILIKPFEDEEVRPIQPQNIIFTWSPSAGAAPGTQYRLKIIELFDPKRNPNDAFLASTQPAFFEKTVSGNVYVFGPADPQLVVGRKYAWAVTALDQISAGGRTTKEGTAFRNGGRSEIRSFIYKDSNAKEAEKESKEPVTKKPKEPKKVINGDIKYDPKIDIKALYTQVAGKLLYAYPEDYKLEKYGKESQILSASNFTSKSQKRPNGGIFEQLYSTSSYLNIIPKAKPLKKVKVNLVMVYAYKGTDNLSGTMPLYDAGGGWKILTSLKDIDLLNYTVNGKNIDNEPITKVLATGYTNENGEFNLGFALKDTANLVNFKVNEPDKEYYMPSYNSPTGKDTTVVEKGNTITNKVLKRTCILVVESPYYCSPFMMIDARPNDNISLPDQVALVKSFNMSINAKNDDEAGQMGGVYGTLENVNVEVFRMKPVDETVPLEEGQNLPPSSIQALKMGDFANVYPISKVDRVIAMGKTNADGKLFVPRVARIGSKKQDIFVAHSYSDKNTGVYNKADGIKTINAYGSNSSYSNGFDGDFDNNLEFNAKYIYSTEDFELFMKSKLPFIRGKVVEQTKGLKNVLVILKQKKVGQNSSSGSFLTNWLDDISEQLNNEIGSVKMIYTDKDGYFEFNDLQPGDYKLEFSKDGYKTNLHPANNTFIKLLMGQGYQTNEINLTPSGRVSACVTDEDGNRVIADLQVNDGAMYKTDEAWIFKGCASFPAAAGKGRKLKIFPRSDEYFTEEYTIDINEDGVTNIPANTLIVRRRKHRINIIVKGTQGNDSMPLEGATVQIKDITAKTDSKGKAYIAFESPGKSFLVRVKPAKGDNFSHWEGEVSIPVYKLPFDYTVNLTPAREVVASVTENKDGKVQPSKGAKVYIKTLKSGWGNNSANYAECFTDANGNCTLKGIPVTENNVEVFVSKNQQYQSSQQSKVSGGVQPIQPLGQGGKVNPTDVKDLSNVGNNNSPNIEAGGTFIGEKKEAYWFNGQVQTKVALNLSFQKDLSIANIWGFPVHIEEVKSLSDGSFSISGSLHSLPDNGSFASLDDQNRLDFKELKVVKASSGINTHQPEASKFAIQQISFPVRIGKELQGKANAYTVSAQNTGNNFTKIYIQKGADGNAEIRSAVQLELSSFEGAYQLSGKIELGENGNPSNILVFKAGETKKRKLNIGSSLTSNTMKNLNFKVHNFNAEADAQKSYIYGDSVRFSSILHTNIQNMTPSDIALEAGYITVLPNKIVPFTGGNNISFSLEKWKVVGQKTNLPNIWQYDNNNGGIIIPKAVVNTGIVSVGLKDLIIKPDKLIADKLELTNADASAFSLGGIVPLEILPGSSTLFSYDPNCYHDNKPHWKLSILSKSGNDVAARVSKLDGLEDGQKIEFGSMNIFSDNQQQLSGTSLKELTLYKVLKLSLTSIDVGNNFFTMVGQAKMDIPNMSNGGGSMVGQVIYSKNASGKVEGKIKPISFDIEGKGQVSFHANNDEKEQQISSGVFSAKGKMKVYDVTSGKSFVLDTKLNHLKVSNGYNTYIEVLDNQKVPLDTKYLSIKGGVENSSMKVIKNEWDNLRLKTILPNGNGGFDMVQDDEKYRTMTLVVKGAIETDPSSGIVGVKGMDTGVGSMSLYYNFDRQEVRGQFLFTPPAPIPCGLVNINSTNVSMAIGANGMYMMCNGVGDVALAGLPLPLTANMTFVAGYYTKPLYQEDVDIILNLAVQKSLPDKMTNGIKGMFSSATLSSNPLDEGFKYDILDVATVAAWAKAGVAFEYRNFLNFNSLTNFDIFAGQYGYGGIDLGGEASILGVGVKGGVSFNIQTALSASASPKLGLSSSAIKESLQSLKLEGCGSVGASFYLGVCIDTVVFGEECLGGSVSQDVSVHFSIDAKELKPKMTFSLGNCGNGMPVNKL